MRRKSQNIGKVFRGYKIVGAYTVNDVGYYIGECIYCGKRIEKKVACFMGNSRISCECQWKYNHHGESRTRLYHIYLGMHHRCDGEGGESDKWYKDRGITVCEEWSGKDGYIHFRDWALSHGYSKELSIDRIDNDKGYSPKNCRWATPKEQTINRRVVKQIEINGESKCAKEWCEFYGMEYQTYRGRIKREMSPYEALTTPLIHPGWRKKREAV